MKKALNASAFTLPSVIFSPFPLNTRTSAYLFLPLTSVVFIDPFPVAFSCPSLGVDPFVCWLLWIRTEPFVPF